MTSQSNHKPSPSTVEIERLGFKATLQPQYDLTGLSIERRVQVRHFDNYAPKEAVDRYAVQMAHSEFPPIVVTRDGWIVDGNTRIGACAKRRQNFFPAYVIDIDMGRATNGQLWDLKILGATLNSQNGTPLTFAEARDDVQACLAQGWKIEQTCRALGLKTAVVSQVKKEMEADAKLTKVGLSIKDVKGATKRALGGVAAQALNDAPFRELSVLALDAGLTSREVGNLAREAKELGSDHAAVARLEQVRGEMADRIRFHALTGNGGPSVSSQIRGKLTFINKYADQVSETIEHNEDAVGVYLDSIEETIVVLQAILAAHTVAKAA